MTGKVEIQRGKERVQKGTLLFQLQKGDIIRVAEGGAAEVVLFQNGARFALPARGAASVEPAAMKPVSGAPPQPLSGLSGSFLRRMKAPPRSVGSKILGVLVRGAPVPDLGPRKPSPNGAVRATPVVLRWAGPVEGDQIQLQIRDGDRVLRRESLPTAAREYRVPDGLLKPGEEYIWTVTAVSGGDTGLPCRGWLRILTANEKTDVAQIEQETGAARQSAPDNPAPILLLAQAYERLGMYDDALKAYQDALRLRPDDGGVQDAVKRLSADG